MTRRDFLCVVVSALIVAGTSFGVRASQAADPISGTWTGQLAPKEGPPPADVVFQLKLDDKGAVKGTFNGLGSPGDVKKGTFDGKSGALRLELGKEGETATLLTLDGKVTKGTVSGTFTGELSGTFTLTKK